MTFKKLSVLIAVLLAAVFSSACSDKNKESVEVKTEVSAEVNEEETQTVEEDMFSEENILDTALNRIKEQKSSSARMNTRFVFEGSQAKMTAETKADITYAAEPLYKHIVLDAYTNSTHVSQSEFYVTGEDDTNVLALSYDGSWYKMYASDMDVFMILGQYDVREVINIFISAASDVKISGKESFNGREVYKAEAVISKEEVPHAIINSGVFVANGLTNLYVEYFDGVKDMPVTFYIDTETGDILKLCYDAADAFQTVSDYAYNLTKDTEAFKDSVRLIADEYYVEIIVEDIDSTNAEELPEEVQEARWLELPEA